VDTPIRRRAEGRDPPRPGARPTRRADRDLLTSLAR